VSNAVSLRKQKMWKQKQLKTTVKCSKAFVLFVVRKSQGLSKRPKGDKAPNSDKVLSTTQSTAFRLKCIYLVTISQDPEQSWTNDWTLIWLQKHGVNPSTELTKQLITIKIAMWKIKTLKRATKFVMKICWQSLTGFILQHSREKFKRGLVSKIIRTKAKFGWGVGIGKKTTATWTRFGQVNSPMNFTNRSSKNSWNERCLWTASIKFGLQTLLKCNNFQSSTAGSGIFWLWLTHFQNMAWCSR